jgi:hypothetical protein
MGRVALPRPIHGMEESPPHAAKRSALAPGPGKSLECYNAFLIKWVIGGSLICSYGQYFL